MPAETAREGYRWSSITSDDVEAWAQLTNHLAVVDGTEEFYDAEDRLEELKDPATDPTLDALAVWSGEQMVGFGTVAVRPNPDREGRARVGVDGGVHPDHRRRGIGAGVMERMEARGRELAQRQHPHRAFHFDTGGGLEDSSARSFHLSRGYQVARHYHLMGRPLRLGEPAGEIITSRYLSYAGRACGVCCHVDYVSRPSPGGRYLLECGSSSRSETLSGSACRNPSISLDARGAFRGSSLCQHVSAADVGFADGRFAERFDSNTMCRDCFPISISFSSQ